ncbi:MAG: peptidylprolyl isomerase, partial [Planctomycetota bacterium]
ETDKGDFWVGFYPEHAPKHVESFVRLAKSGALNGTKVYVVTPNRVEFGGEATKDDDPFNDTPTREDDLLDSEPGRFRIKQDRGALSTVAHDGGESPTRFAVVVGMSDLGLEKKQTVFGKVLTDRGTAMEALDEIKNVKTYGSVKDPAYDDDKYKKIPDHPVEPIVIERVSIWTGDAIEDGHEWDTAEVTPPEKQKITKPTQKGEDEQEPAKEKEIDEGDAGGEKKGDSPTEPDEEKDN